MKTSKVGTMGELADVSTLARKSTSQVRRGDNRKCDVQTHATPPLRPTASICVQSRKVLQGYML